MKNFIIQTPKHSKSTYQLLVQSQEKERSFIEALTYLCLVGAAVASIWQFTQQSVQFTQLGVLSTEKAVTIEAGVARS